MGITPVARSLFLCDNCLSDENGKVIVQGVFNSIRPIAGYPHRKNTFRVFTQLTNGLGRVALQFDIRSATTGELIYTTPKYEIEFPTKHSIKNVSMHVQSCEFPESGLYLVQLLCDNAWVSDAELHLT